MIARRLLLLLVLATVLAGAGPASTEAASLAAAGSAITGVEVIGHSVQGRPIVAWRLGDPTSRTKVVVMAAMHGDEPGPSRVLRNLRDGRAIHGADIWVVPTYNPDGVARHRRQNADGVDLNRNWPASWVHTTGATYAGPRPASEPETRAIMAFLEQVRPQYVISFHQPLHGVGRAGAKGRALVRRLHRGLGLPVKSFDCSGTCHGTMTEWFNAHFPGVAVTVEYGRGVSRRQARVSGPDGLLRAVGAWR